jgi:hypothetical protein
MNKVEKVSLIEGDFSDIEAREVLVNLYLTKIRFHEMKNFSSKERFGKEDKNSLDKIAELKTTLKKINEFITEVSLNKQRIIINATIALSVSEN